MAATKLNEVFVPGSFPRFNFVDRKTKGSTLTKRVADQLDAPGMMVALIGPSKSGKTQLIRRALADKIYVRISGSEIKNREDLLQALRIGAGFPDELTTLRENAETGEFSGAGGLSFGGALLKSKIDAALKFGRAKKSGENKRYSKLSISDIAAVSKKEGLVFFLDNFHYIPEQELVSISQTLRSAIEDGLRCCIAYVPQKKDMILQGNEDLNNKATRIDVGTWKIDELAAIGELGFKKLNRQVSNTVIQSLANEACFSPQIMQQLCFDLCKLHGIEEASEISEAVVADRDLILTALYRTGENIHFDDITRKYLEGRIDRRDKKLVYKTNRGVEGDFYKIALAILAMNPAQMQFRRTEIAKRLRELFSPGDPKPALHQIDKTIERLIEVEKSWSLEMFINRLQRTIKPSKEDIERIRNLDLNFLLEYRKTSKDSREYELFLLDPSFLYFIRNLPEFEGLKGSFD